MKIDIVEAPAWARCKCGLGSIATRGFTFTNRTPLGMYNKSTTYLCDVCLRKLYVALKKHYGGEGNE